MVNLIREYGTRIEDCLGNALVSLGMVDGPSVTPEFKEWRRILMAALDVTRRVLDEESSRSMEVSSVGDGLVDIYIRDSVGNGPGGLAR